jgi:hypothetical protein
MSQIIGLAWEGPFHEATSFKEKAEHPGAYVDVR